MSVFYVSTSVPVIEGSDLYWPGGMRPATVEDITDELLERVKAAYDAEMYRLPNATDAQEHDENVESALYAALEAVFSS